MKIFLLIVFFSVSLLFGHEGDFSSLSKDLQLVEKINSKINDRLPFFYNTSFMGGYFNMPSARMASTGNFSFGWARVPPYDIFGANFQPMDRIEVSANYRIYRGILEKGFGKMGFGDDADRIANVKFGIIKPEDGWSFLPSLAFGLDDFIGTKRFSSKYLVLTKEWMDKNIEISLGWGSGRIRKWFGGVVWTPFRKTSLFFLKNLSLIGEYDAINYKKHSFEHEKGRSVRSRINGGVGYILGDTLQFTLGSVRGKKLGGSISIRYPLGQTSGFFTKTENPLLYHYPVDIHPLGFIRSEEMATCELACAFRDQGFDLQFLKLVSEPRIEIGSRQKIFWIRLINQRYRKEQEVRERIENLLASLIPSNIDRTIVQIESEGIVSHEYQFRTSDLYAYRQKKMGKEELAVLSPMKEARAVSHSDNVQKLFEKDKEAWTFSLYPRLITFFGSTRGKFKYTLGVVSSFEGYLYGQVYYKLQVGYSVFSSMKGLSGSDLLNPSKLFQVRSDSLKYFQTQTVSLEKAFVQRGWNLGKGWFFRLSGGYFEPAYGGGAGELLLYPVNCNWAIGVEAATVLKRKYRGFSFFSEVPKVIHGEMVKRRFVGIQYFLDLYYDFKPLNLNFKINVGQFLAKDKGVKIQATKIFSNGLRFSLWLTLTNGKDMVNGRTYFDKGFAFVIPFDFFLKKSSRKFVQFAMSAWLRDVGAISQTGSGLYDILYEERLNLSQ
ncbi:MAG: YjbH domain-containing protein [Chlamydiae bacterium]|nr:YjbH domain-containing protein [Chlamydiota bacterium]